MVARIVVENGGAEVRASPAVSILNTLMQNGIGIAHKCGGKAICGTCRIKIVSGGEILSPKTEAEIIRLKAMGDPEGVRLACQTYAAGEVRIKIPSLRRAPPGRSGPRPPSP